MPVGGGADEGVPEFRSGGGRPGRARAAYERALAIDEAAFGPQHPEVARDVSNLGSVLRDLCDLAGARATIERALVINEAAYGREHLVTAKSLWWLGTLARDAGDLQEACLYLEEALSILKRFLPADHPHIATVRANLEACQVGEEGDDEAG